MNSVKRKKLNKKVIGLFICILLIITVLSVSGSTLDSNNNLRTSHGVVIYYNTGVIVGEECTYSFEVCNYNTEGDIYVFINWGDNENELIGPILQCEKIEANHTYDVEGNYETQLIFNDSEGIFHEFDNIIYVRDIEIGEITGGLRLKVTVKNNGDLPVNVSEGWWGFIFEHRNGKDFWRMEGINEIIDPHDEIILKSKIKTFFLVHLLIGKTKITFGASYQGLELKTVNGYIIGPFVFII